MNKLFPTYFSFLILFYLTCTEGYGQHLDITTYLPKDGFSVIGANSISQDKNGWIWLTDALRLMRYDGNTIKSYYPVAGSQMNFNYGSLDVGDEIWVQASPYLMKVSGDSLVPLDVSDSTIDLIHAMKYKGTQYILEKKGLYILDKRKLQEYIVDASLGIGDYAELIPYSDSLLLAYERGKSLVIFNIKQHSFYRIPLAVIEMRRTPEGAIYLFLKDEGLVSLKRLIKTGDKWEAENEVFCKLDYNEKQFGGFIIDKKGNFWIWEQFQWLMRITPEKKITKYTEANGLPGVWFFRVMADKDNNIWLGLHGALAKISQASFERFTSVDGLYFNHVNFITTDGLGSTYVGTGKGLNIYSREKFHRARLGDRPFQCDHLMKTKDGFVYARDSVLFSARFDSKNFNVHSERRLATLPGITHGMKIDEEGSIYINTNKGLCAWYQTRLYRLLSNSHYYRSIFLDAQNRLWAGLFVGGVSCYKIDYEKGFPQLTPIHTINQDSSLAGIKNIRSLMQDAKGNIIVGTRFTGLFYLEMDGNKVKKVHQFQKGEGLGSNAIWSLARDARGDIWIGHDVGLSRLSVSSGKLVVSDESKQRQVYLTYHIVFDGKQFLWVDSHPGVIKIDIFATPSSNPFLVYITSVKAEGKQITIDKTGERSKFDYKENTFNIEFSSNSFLDEKAIAYSYRLVKNGNEKWSDPSPVHLVNYSSLLPGGYQFQVKALGVNGNWSNNTASYSFEILPPFWQTAWFISAAAFLFLLGLYIIYRYRIAQILKLQQMRNNISRNLHDDIGASLSSINILNELAKRNIHETAKAESYMQQAGEDIQRISESLSDIVWNINPRYDQIGNLFARMKRYAADMMDGRKIETDFVFPPDESNLHLPMDKRRDFYLIFKEAVNNLVKYSGASKAIVEVKTGNSKIVLRIEDNGVGFHTPNSEQGNGLHNMRERAKKWNSPLQIVSEPGKGTRVILEMKT